MVCLASGYVTATFTLLAKTCIVTLQLLVKRSLHITGAIVMIHPPKYHHDFLQFGKQHSRYKDILSSVVWSQHCCDSSVVKHTSSLLL